MATASLLPRHYPALFTGHSRSAIKTKFPSSFDVRRKPNPRFSPSSTTSSADSSFSWDHEEKRWLREEQRWLREEQRWLREETRWSSEREALLLEIASLRLRVKALEGDRSPLAASVEAVLIAEKRRPLLAEAETVPVEEDELNEKVREGIRIPLEEKGEEMLKEIKERKTLRIGSEGEDVREMQDNTNGAPVSSLQKFKETQEAVIKEADDAQTEMSGHRVYLLGENRWEEPSRLRLDKSVESVGAKSRTQCLTCRGEGKVLCTECDGSGEPNVEPQFLEWIGEGTKCPYCEGLGYIICDVCN